VVDGYDKYQFYMGQKREKAKGGDDGSIAKSEMVSGESAKRALDLAFEITRQVQAATI
jgi:hypothetical protein